MLLGSIRNRITRNTGMDKNREMKKKSYVQTVEASWLISLGMGLKYFTQYALSVNGALPLPSCIMVIDNCLRTPTRTKYLSINFCLSLSSPDYLLKKLLNIYEKKNLLFKINLLLN